MSRTDTQSITIVGAMIDVDDRPLPRREPRVRQWHLSRIDLAIATALAAATLTVSLYFAPRGFHAGFVDMGHDGYQLRQILDLSRGRVIFRDTFDQYGPLNGYLNLVGFLTFGGRLLAVKYFICAWYAVIAGVLYVLARRWLGPPLAAFTVLLWLGLAPFYNHGIMISPHVYALFLQAVAALIALRSANLEPRRFAAIGVLAGLAWAVKQSIGTLFLLAIFFYLLLRWLLGRASSRRAASAAMAMSLAFAVIVGTTLVLLWRFGALRDWYLQTIVFPREFYLATSDRPGTPVSAAAIVRLLDPLREFARLQWTQSVYWILIRAVVLITAVAEVIRRRTDDDLLLMGSVTAFLWLSAYPSGNFMHQWWTASLTFAPFVFCVRRLVARRVGNERAPWWTMALVSVLVASGLVARWNAVVFTKRTLTETVTDPPLFRGVRTNRATKNALQTLYGIIVRYRLEHPGTKVVSIESADGWGGGMVESLPLVSSFADNTGIQPLYWSLPVLSTTVYPRYGETLWRFVRDEHPLIVDHRYGRYRSIHIAGYRLLAAAQSDVGHWYIHVPVAMDAITPTTYLTADGALEEVFPVEAEMEASEPELAVRLNTSTQGAWRGSALPSSFTGGLIRLEGDYPFELNDPAQRHPPGPVNVYTWPSDLPAADLSASIVPVSTQVKWRAGRGDIVREFRPGAWTVDGEARSPFSYLLQWPEEPVPEGAIFVARGELIEGGVQLGFLEHDRWIASVIITRPGLFAAVLQMQAPGRYSLVSANSIESSWWQRAHEHPLSTTFGLLLGRLLPNRFRVSEAGWIRSTPFPSDHVAEHGSS